MRNFLLLGILTGTVISYSIFTEENDEFDIKLAEKTFDFAAASYAEDPWHCARKHNATVVFRTTMPCDYLRNECWAVITADARHVTVAFRGTRSKLQLISELLETMGEPKKKLHAGGSVQHYFYVALQSIWPPMERVLHKLLKINPNRQFIFTGHSLGGALASISSVMFAHRHPQAEVSLITFGEPRAGNHEFADTQARLLKNSWRIVHRYDLVAHIPYCYEHLLSHTCSPLFNHGPWHHGTEIWFPGNMTAGSLYKICGGIPRYEDSTCSNSVYLHYRISDHLVYFGHEVSDYGDNGCHDNKLSRSHSFNNNL